MFKILFSKKSEAENEDESHRKAVNIDFFELEKLQAIIEMRAVIKS